MYYTRSLLSPSEMKVLNLLSQGYDNSEIAKSLYLSIKTVQHHINSIFHRANVPSGRDKRVWVALNACELSEYKVGIDI